MQIRNGLWPKILTAVLILAGCVPLKAYHADEDEVAQVHGRIPASNPPALSVIPPYSEVPRTENETPRPIDMNGAHTCPDAENRNEAPKTCMAVVEFDDFGRLFNRAQLETTLETARKIARGPATKTAGNEEVYQDGGVIIVYAHGWKHNAGDGAGNDFAKFKVAIQNLAQLEEKVLPKKRRIMGIYVGWRGDSIQIPYVKNLTFWDRKITAHAVGNGAVAELFKQLTLIRNAYPTSRLVVVGHSFGSAVVYSAMEHQILSEIIESPQANSATVPVSELKKRWDMVILINAAFEAMQVRAQYAAARSRNYKPGQLPHLVFITSEADWATRYAFPAGRRLSTIFKRYADTDSSGEEMNLSAVGHYIPYVTHQLVAQDTCAAPEKNADPGPASPADHGEPKPMNARDTMRNVIESFYSPTKSYCFGDRRTAEKNAPFSKHPVKVTVLTQCDAMEKCEKVAQGHYIDRDASSPKVMTVGGKERRALPVPRYMPLMNIRATKDVMNGHNDIWNPVMQNFMVQFVYHSVISPFPQEENQAHSDKALDTGSAKTPALIPAPRRRTETKAGRPSNGKRVTAFTDAIHRPGR